jgi:hypothetical protein
MIAELAPANAAIVTAAVMAGSAPEPASEAVENGSGVRVLDDRAPGKCRVDALMDLVHAGARAAAGDTASGVGGAATVLVTMDLEILTEGVGGASTPVGDVLDAGAARRAACDADLIPVVLARAEPTVGCGSSGTLGDQGSTGRGAVARPRVHVPRL